MPCRACGHPHPATMRCEVWRAINASNAINNETSQAINAQGGESSAVGDGAVCGPDAGDGGVPPAVRDRTANRRSRRDYNAYMREYMRKRRA